jgi:ribosomal protein S18 acetylase RimI-like enzyme
LTEVPALPAGLPPSWTVRRPTAPDVDAIFALLVAVDRASLGYSDWSREDAEAEVLSSCAPADRNQLLVTDGERALAWATAEDRAAGRISVDVAVDRDLPAEQADALAAWALDWLAVRAGVLARDRDRPDTFVDAGIVEGDEAQERWLRAAGFARVRTYWRMSRSVAGLAETSAAAPGVTLRKVVPDVSADIKLVHAMVEEAFADHWNHHPRTFAEWWRSRREGAGHDLDLWWLAELDGEPVGALIATRQMQDEGALYVSTLGVRRQGRGRGVARSLLREAFAEARRRGLERVSLTVDGASPTGATALYRSEGMTVDFAMGILQRPVTVW